MWTTTRFWDRSGIDPTWIPSGGGLRSVPDRSTLFRAEWERKHVLKAIQLNSLPSWSVTQANLAWGLLFLQFARCLQKKGEQWTEAETRALIAAWGDRQIQDKIDKSHRNADVYTEIAKAVAKQGFPGRDWKQCRTKAKHLKAEFETFNDHCKKSGNARKKEPTFFKELKEQYPVIAHAPNFDFWTGCRKIKRCEESKITLKNPFAPRLAGFNTTLKLLRITDQWNIVPVKFRSGQNLDFLALLLLPLAGRPLLEALWCRLKANTSSASFHTSSDNCERNTQKWNSNNKDKKETIEKLMWLRRSCGGKLREAERFAKLLNESPSGRQNQTNRRYMFRKTSSMKS